MPDTTPEVGIGSTVWKFNANRRRYGADRLSPIYREHWEPRKIVGETSRSWILDGPWGEKIPKKRAERDSLAYSETEINGHCFVEAYRYRIAQEVQRCVDVTKLRAIAEIVGWKEPDGGK